MIIIDEDLLDEFRGPGPCEWCGKSCLRREPHHIFARALGGGGRLDIRCNLVGLGSSIFWECACHQAAHAGLISRLELLQVAGQRECYLASISRRKCGGCGGSGRCRELADLPEFPWPPPMSMADSCAKRQPAASSAAPQNVRAQLGRGCGQTARAGVC
jgi:hypothetical protein